jgi:hypothetical protein
MGTIGGDAVSRHWEPDTMDNHERGVEKTPGRMDTPLPEWKGSYGGDRRKLPLVVQKLVHKRRLTAEEKAELLWRIYELDVASRERRDRARSVALLLFLGLAGLATWVFLSQPWITKGILDLMYPVNG